MKITNRKEFISKIDYWFVKYVLILFRRLHQSMRFSWKYIKELVSGSHDFLTLGSSNVLISMIGGIFWFIIASIVNVGDYGKISYLMAISSIGAVVSFLGIGNAVTVYTAKKEKIQGPIFLLAIISSLITSVVIFFIFYNIGASVYVVGYVIFGLVTYEILGHKLYKQYSKYVITQKLLMVGLALLFEHFLGTDGVVLGIGVSFLPYAGKVYSVFRKSQIDFSILWSKKIFVMNSYAYEIARILSSSLDKLIIAPLFGFAILGNYQLGVQFLMISMILPTTLYLYLLPQEASGRSNRSIKKIIILGSVGLTLLIIVISPILITLLFPTFTQSTRIIQIMSIAIIPSSINQIFISKFLGQEKSNVVLIGSLIYVATQITSIVLLGKIFGLYGIASAVVISTVAELSYLICINKKNGETKKI